jgi:hypothetical protein
MPQRPEQHRTASRAVAAVRRIWADEGAAVDEIGEDYGEDLLVQPCLNGRMDKSRLWIQVKGTAAAMRLEKAKAPFMPGFVEVDRDLAMRWLGSADLVVVVRWSVVHQVGWYVIPKLTLGALDFWDENDEPKARVRLRLRLDNPFDAAAARKLAWIARLDNAAAGLRGAPVAGSGRRELDPATRDSVWRLMGDLELLELSPAGGGAISPRFLSSIMMNLVTHGPELSGDDDENRKLSLEWMESSFKSVVQQFLGELLPPGVPVPDVLFEEMFGMLNLIRAIQFHRALHS